MSSHVGKIWTYDDYAALPDDGHRYEVIDGELFMTPAANIRHQDILGWVFVQLYNHVRAHGGGKVFVSAVDVVLSPTNVVQPDVLFVSDADRERVTAPNVQGAPTLAVEVLSDARHDRVRKRRLYEQFGVREYWIADPHRRQVEVYRLEGGAYPSPAVFNAGDTLTTPLLPGLGLDVETLLSGGE